MGPDPVPIFANLFLFYYELQYTNSYKKENISAWKVLLYIQIYR